MRRRARIGRLLHRQIGPFEPFFWSIMAVLLCCALRLVGVEGIALNAVQFVPTIVLIVAVPLLADILLSSVVPGASDNASGVATVLRLADRYGERARLVRRLGAASPAPRSRCSSAWAPSSSATATSSTRQSTIFLCVDDVGARPGPLRDARRATSWPTRSTPTWSSSASSSARRTPRTPTTRSSRSSPACATDALPRPRGRATRRSPIGCANELGYAPDFHQPTDTAGHDRAPGASTGLRVLLGADRADRREDRPAAGGARGAREPVASAP